MISNNLGYTRTDDLGKYLGMPLVQGRVTLRTYDELISKVEKRIAGWKVNKLSLAGRITLAQSVLSAISTFAMQTTKLPHMICDEIDRKIRRFIWGSTCDSKKIHLISWQQICKSKAQGGLGFRNSRQQNLAFLMKLAWGIMTKPEELWVQVFRKKYGKLIWDNNSVKTRGNLSYQRRGILAAWENVKNGLMWQIGDGKLVSFWNDAWIEPNTVLNAVVPDSMIGETYGFVVNQFLTDAGTWNWDLLAHLPMAVKQQLNSRQVIPGSSSPDRMIWSHSSNGKFTIASAYDSMETSVGDSSQNIWKKIWAWQGPQRVRTFLWLCTHEALLTNEKRARIGLTDNAGCPRCSSPLESTLHVVRDCFFIKSIWQSIVPPTSWQVFFSSNLKDWLTFGLAERPEEGFDISWRLTFGLVPWLAWKWRNLLVFKEDEVSNEPPLATIQRYIQDITSANIARNAVKLSLRHVP